jgi:hypothetical protein
MQIPNLSRRPKAGAPYQPSLEVERSGTEGLGKGWDIYQRAESPAPSGCTRYASANCVGLSALARFLLSAPRPAPLASSWLQPGLVWERALGPLRVSTTFREEPLFFTYPTG